MRFARPRGRPRSSRCAADLGFTLIEALVALAVLSLAVVTTIEALRAGLRTQAVARRQLEAVSVADEMLNRLALLPRDSLAGYASGRTGVMRVGDRRYRWRAVAREQGVRSHVWAIGVRVEWEDGELELETRVHRPEGLRAGRRGS